MDVVASAPTLAERVAAARHGGRSIALVPTMGNLHEGHLRLVDAARARAGFVVASLFVNPLQFGPGEDLERYPRTFEADRRALLARGCDLLFAPRVRDVYPDGPDLATRVTVRGLADELCGAARPGHFDGVATVVTKLLNLVRPDLAVFGRKDLQQLVLIRRLVRDLSIPVRVHGVATARAADGLALSSRNGYLDADERARAPALHRALAAVARHCAAGRTDHETLLAEARAALAAAGMRPDYVEIRRAEDLGAPQDAPPGELIVLGAARLGATRLIDNVSVREVSP